jgi:hypothetical protein
VDGDGRCFFDVRLLASSLCCFSSALKDRNSVNGPSLSFKLTLTQNFVFSSNLLFFKSNNLDSPRAISREVQSPLKIELLALSFVFLLISYICAFRRTR